MNDIANLSCACTQSLSKSWNATLAVAWRALEQTRSWSKPCIWAIHFSMIPLCFVRCLHVLLAYGTGMFPAHAALMIMCMLLFGCCWTSCVGYTCTLCVVCCNSFGWNGTFYVCFECIQCLCASCVRVEPWLVCTACFWSLHATMECLVHKSWVCPRAYCPVWRLSALRVCFWELKVCVCFVCLWC